MGGTLSRTSGTAAQSKVEIKSFVEEEVISHQVRWKTNNEFLPFGTNGIHLVFFLIFKVVIWSKSWCGYCRATKQLFQKPEFKTVDVKVHELDRVSNGNAIQQILELMTGQRTVPSVWVAGKFVGGNDDTRNAYRSGRIQTLLGLNSKL